MHNVKHIGALPEVRRVVQFNRKTTFTYLLLLATTSKKILSSNVIIQTLVFTLTLAVINNMSIFSRLASITPNIVIPAQYLIQNLQFVFQDPSNIVQSKIVLYALVLVTRLMAEQFSLTCFLLEVFSPLRTANTSNTGIVVLKYDQLFQKSCTQYSGDDFRQLIPILRKWVSKYLHISPSFRIIRSKYDFDSIFTNFSSLAPSNNLKFLFPCFYGHGL